MAGLFSFLGFHALFDMAKNLFKEVGTDEVKGVIKRRRENDPRKELEKVFEILTRTKDEQVVAWGVVSLETAYPRLYHLVITTYSTRWNLVSIGAGGIGWAAKVVLDEYYEKYYEGKLWENDFATCLGYAICHKTDNTIDEKETVLFFLYLAEFDDDNFKRAMSRLKHDPFSGPAKIYWEEGKKKVAEAWEYVQDEYPDAEKKAVKQIQRLRKVVQAHNEKKRNEGRIRRWLGI